MNSVALIILDGYGIAPPNSGNAIYLANPQNINSYMHDYPYTLLEASGEAVGLPTGEVGNTEVGHLNLGAGRIVYQNLLRINTSIADGSFYKNKAFKEALVHLKKTNGSLHLLGLIGAGTVHASVEHLYALLYFCGENQFNKVFIHAITDGRDSPPKMTNIYLDNIQKKINTLNIGEIATVIGRYYAMDRDKRWERTEKAYLCLTEGKGQKANSWLSAVKNSYKKNKTDEFIEPTNIIKNDKPVALINEGDAVIFYNFRIDRPRQLTKAFILDNFEQEANKIFYDPYAIKYTQRHILEKKILSAPFKRKNKIKNLYFATMTEYEINLPAKVAFSLNTVDNPLGKVLSDKGITQLRLTESEKERFVTYYFNGEQEIQFPKEERLIIPSPKVETYDLKPEMSAYEITDVLIDKISLLKYQFILVNFPNLDMLGHTGNIQAVIKAIKTLDQLIAKIVQTALKLNYTIIITSDHGNAEEMIDLKTGETSTEHSGNLVPFIIIGNQFEGRQKKLNLGILADVAPTILYLLNIKQPAEMMGRNLLEDL